MRSGVFSPIVNRLRRKITGESGKITWEKITWGKITWEKNHIGENHEWSDGLPLRERIRIIEGTLKLAEVSLSIYELAGIFPA